MCLLDQPGKTNLAQHRITLTTDEPVKAKIYPLPYMMRDTVNNEMQQMLDLDIIEQSESPFATTVVMVRKKDGSNRVCIDYRQLNRVTIFDPEPMPRHEDIYAKLSKDKFFSKLDLSKGYWQIAVAPEDRPKTAFLSPDLGSFQFKRMPFGLVNSAATFNRMMRKLLHGMSAVDSYVDDILVHTPTFEEHVRVLRELFGRLHRAGLTVKRSKCRFGFTKLEYVGHEVGSGEVAMTQENIDKIRAAAQPTNKKTLRSFLGLAGYYRNHIPNFSSIALPLTNLTKKKQPNVLQWGEEQENSFVTLKELLTSNPVLQLPNFEQSFVLQTDASDEGLGAALLQPREGQLMPVSFASRKLLPRERAYSVMEKECLAVVWAVNKFKCYLYGREFVLQTDHQPLISLSRSRVANDRVMRWSLLLQPYRMRIEAIKGSDNVIADYLSRC